MNGDGGKAAARAAAADRRQAALAAAGPDGIAAALTRLQAVLWDHAGRVLAGYMPMRTEIDPLPAMAAHPGPVCVPVVAGRAQPLIFHAWTPGCPMTAGAFGARVPVGGAVLVPEVLIVPLLAFDRAGYRLGYGGGFYDRTLAALRAQGSVTAIGFAFAAQEIPAVPRGPHDARLDLIVTDRGVLHPD